MFLILPFKRSAGLGGFSAQGQEDHPLGPGESLVTSESAESRLRQAGEFALLAICLNYLELCSVPLNMGS